jgi:hypothetical protein
MVPLPLVISGVLVTLVWGVAGQAGPYGQVSQNG